MRGIIYCYTSPSGKKYIGQTTSEIKRKSRFKDLTKNYGGGGKIDNARKKYHPENFLYCILEENNLDEKELHNWLNDRERYWIAFYNTYKAGYNSTEGGSIMKTKEWREHHSNLMKEKYGGKMPDHLQETYEKSRNAVVEACKKKIEQYSLDLKYIKTWESAADAARALNKKTGTMISNCANGRNASAYGYKWKYVDSDWPNCNKSIKTRKIGKYNSNWELITVYNSGKEATEANPPKNNPVTATANYNDKHKDSPIKRYGFYYKFLDYGT